MQKFKTCFFEKISTIELAFQADLFSNHIHMGGKNTLATTAMAVAMTTTSPAFSESSETLKKETITCETKQACQELTESLQVQIDEINSQSELSKESKRLRYNLRKQLIALEKSETKKNTNLISTENQKQEKQQKTIATEKSDTKKQEQLIEAKLKVQDAQIAGLRGALLEN